MEPGTYRAVEVDTGSDGHILNTTPQEVELEAGDGIKELMFFNDVKPGLRLPIPLKSSPMSCLRLNPLRVTTVPKSSEPMKTVRSS